MDERYVKKENVHIHLFHVLHSAKKTLIVHGKHVELELYVDKGIVRSLYIVRNSRVHRGKHVIQKRIHVCSVRRMHTAQKDDVTSKKSMCRMFGSHRLSL